MYTMNEVMTREPATVDVHACLAEASEQMATLGVRQLVVTDRGRIVGLIDDHDVDHFLARKKVSPEIAAVGEAMVPEPLIVTREEPLAPVARVMASRPCPCVVVAETGRPIGVFSARDALRLLAKLVS